MIKKRMLLKMLPFIIILVVTCVLLVTELISLDMIRADNSIETQEIKSKSELIPFFWTVGIVGGCIGLTLVYVSWRKYKAEEKKELEKIHRKKYDL